MVWMPELEVSSLESQSLTQKDKKRKKKRNGEKNLTNDAIIADCKRVLHNRVK